MVSDWATNKLDSAWESRHLGAFVACLQENFCKQFQEFIPTDRISHMREVVGSSPTATPINTHQKLFSSVLFERDQGARAALVSI
jgi:hypothetical protein